MLLHSHIDENTLLYIDVEAAQGFSKDEGRFDAHPDQILDSVVKVSTVVATKLAASARAAADIAKTPPSSLKLEFGIKVNGESVVMVAPRPDAAHFRVTAVWRNDRD